MARLFKSKHLLGLILAAALGATLSLIPEVNAQSFLPLPSSADLDVPAPEGDTAIQKAESILGPIGRVIRIVMGSIAVLFLIVSGVTMVVGGDNEENVKKQKQAMSYTIIGLLMLSIAGPVASVFDFRAGNFLEDPDSIVERAQLFDATTQLIITFVKYFLGAYAIAMFMSAGFTMVSSSAEEDINKAKKSIMLSVFGLLMVVMSDLVIRRLFFDAEYNDTASKTLIAINQNEIIRQVVAVTNIMVTFVGPIMMLVFVAGGVLYVTAGGNEERTSLAQKIMMNAVIGVVIIYGAFALVSTVISGIF